MAGTGLSKLMVIYVCIAIGVYIGGTTGLGDLGGITNSTLSRYANITASNNTTSITIGDDLESSLPTPPENAFVQAWQTFTGTLSMIWNGIALFVDVAFWPATLLNAIGAPWPIVLMGGIPLSAMVVYALIDLIWAKR